MEITKKSRRQLRMQGVTFAALFLALVGIAGWLSTQYHYQADWTAAGRNTLAPGTVAVLNALKGPVTITVFAREADSQVSRRGIGDFLKRYQQAKPDLTVAFVNPDLHPEKVKEYGIMVEGEFTVEYQGRRENVQNLSEQAVTNALQRVARGGQRPLLFLTGHGERKGNGQANHDLGAWGEQLAKKGFAVSAINLAEKPQLPDSGSVLVLTAPGVNLLPGEVQLVRQFVAKGGNLLWLGDPGDLHGLKPLADDLGVLFLPGTIVDPTTQLLGIGNPTFAIIADYPAHPATKGLDSVSLLPTAAALDVKAPQGWQAAPLLRTVDRAWDEITPIGSSVSFDAGKDRVGPLTVGAALTRELKEADGTSRTQRIVIIGDGDFLSNSFVGNGANLDLGDHLVNWLSHEDAFINIPARAAPDVRLDLSRNIGLFIGLGFLLVIPGALLTTGLVIWMKRRKR
jgi:ABC-type uncharacterized transport system involved in gliding motility auxiliary subunit